MSIVQQAPSSSHEDTLEACEPSSKVKSIVSPTEVVGHQESKVGMKDPQITMKVIKEGKTKIKKDVRQQITQPHYQSPLKDKSISSHSSEENPWKADNEFSKEIIKWNHYFLVPNPKSEAENFQCGLCKCIFLKIVEFTHHCFSICGEIYHAESSHFIISDSLLSNTLYKTIDKGQMKIIEGQSRNLRTKSLKRKRNGRYCSTKYLQGRLRSQKDTKQRKSNQQIEKSNLVTKKYLTEKRQQELADNRQNGIKANCPRDKSKMKQDNYQPQQDQEESKIKKAKKKYKIKGINKTFTPITEQKLEEFTKQKTQKIKQESKSIIQMWKKIKLQADFSIHKNYRPFYPSFVFLLNPLRNIVNHISDQCELCNKNYWKSNFRMADHFMGKCCDINTQESTYIILWSQDFYQYLYDRSENHYEKNLDIVYWKYLYEKTPESSVIDAHYPKFKYHLGFLQSYIFAHSITGVCRFCDYVRPAQFIEANKRKHNQSCILLQGSKRELIRISRDQNHRFFNKDLLNVEMVQEYTFFCPCKSMEEQFGVNQLIEHLQSAHPSKIHISLQAVFHRK